MWRVTASAIKLHDGRIFHLENGAHNQVFQLIREKTGLKTCPPHVSGFMVSNGVHETYADREQALEIEIIYPIAP